MCGKSGEPYWSAYGHDLSVVQALPTQEVAHSLGEVEGKETEVKQHLEIRTSKF